MAMATRGSIERLIFTSFLLSRWRAWTKRFRAFGTARCLSFFVASGHKSSGTMRCPANEIGRLLSWPRHSGSVARSTKKLACNVPSVIIRW